MAARIQLASLFFSIEGDTDDLQKGLASAEKTIKTAFDKMAAGGNQVVTATDKVSGSLKRTGQSSVDLASKLYVAQQAYNAVRNVVREGIDIAKLGASMERVERRFEAFAARADGSTAMLEAFQRGAGGTVDKLNAMNNAALLMQQGLVTNAAQMEKTVELATRLGNQTLGATDRINTFSQLLRNQSIRLLDDFGISSSKVRDRMKELQAQTAGLSREEAFRMAVFEQGQIALDILGDRVEDNAAKMERAQARLADWRIEMGQKVAPVVAFFAEQLAQTDAATLALVTGLTGLIGVASRLTGGMGNLIAKLGLTGTQFVSLAGAIGIAMAAYEGYRRVQKAVAEGQEQVNRTLQEWDSMAQQAIDEGASLNTVVSDMAQRANKANEVLHRNGNALEDVAAAIARATSENKIFNQVSDEVRSIIISQAGSFEEANQLIKQYNATVTNSKARVEELSEVTFNLNKRQRTLNAAVQEGIVGEAAANLMQRMEGTLALGGAIFDVNILQEQSNRLTEFNNQLLEQSAIQLEETAKATAEMAEKTLSLDDILSIAGSSIDDAGRNLDQVRIALGQVSVEQVKVRDDIELLSRAYDAGTISLDEYVSGIEEAQQGTLDLTFEQRKNITESLNQKIALDEYRESLEKTREVEEKRLQTLQDQVRAQLDQAEALKGAGEREIAQAAIRELEEAQSAGLITFEDFTTAVVEIQDKFGLADDRSRALTLGLGKLVEEFAAGGLQADQFDDALGLMIQDAEDGVIAFDELRAQIALLNEELGATETVIDAMTGLEVPVGLGAGGPREIMAGPATGGGRGAVFDAATGQFVEAAAPGAVSGAQIFIENLNLAGIQDVENFLRQLQALTE